MKKNKKFDSVKLMRGIRNKIDSEIKGLDKNELKAYFRKKKEEYERKYGHSVSSQNE